MKSIVEMTICSDCNEFLGIDHGTLNQEWDCREDCEICQRKFETKDQYLSAYNIELDIKDFLIAITRRLPKFI